MRKSLVALLLMVGATAFVANLAQAGLGFDEGENVHAKIMNAHMAKELQSRASRLGSSATDVDTTYVGYSPGHSADNYWSIWSGSDKFSVPSGPYHRPPAKGAMWDFEPPYTDVHGDSMQGWWAVRKEMTGTGGLTIADFNRPWRALDFGNLANHVYGANKRTFGVVGVWHVDGGNTTVVPASTTWTGEAAGSGGVNWAPLTGTKSAWMGLRRHGDTSHIDAVAQGGTGNHFNEDVMQFKEAAALAAGGSDKKFPGYGSQMDQLLYRDVDVTGVGDLTVSFQYRTSMSTSFGSNNLTRTGWFQHDPLTVITGGSNPNFISNQSTVATPPVDSLMVYVGAPAEGSVTLSDGASHTIYDAKRRWFGEVIRSNEGLYKQIFSIGGTVATTTTPDLVIPAATLAPIKAAGANKVRLVFRVKTNFGFDDGLSNTQGYSSGGVGAAIIDEVKVKKDAGAFVTIGTFEATTDIDNSTGVSAETKWKSTGKPTEPFHHAHFLSNSGPSATLQYQDLCGQVGNPARICDLQGVIVSMGDHDFDERSGGTFGTAEQERFQGMFSPVIQLAASGTENAQGLTADEADGSEDYYADYEIYTGLFDFSPTGDGNAWRFGVMCYPGGTSASGTGEHPRWSTLRNFGFIYANGPHQCFRNLDGLRGLMRTTSPDGIPDSIRIFLKIRQEAYRFGIPQSEFLDGAYWDNISLAIVDGEGADPLAIDIWQLYSDTFPFNDTPGIEATSASFDTTTALIKNGLNNAQGTGNTSRFNVPGDTTQVYAEGDNARIDLVFRILPGPGNYVNAALGVNSQLRAVPTSVAPIPTPVGGTTNFWSNYLLSNGGQGSPGGHPVAAGGPLAGQKIWSPQVWNSARMDTAQANVFQMHGRGVRTPGDPALFMTAYHEDELFDPHRGALGIARNICFVADTAQTVSTQTIVCKAEAISGGVFPPAWASFPGTGFNGVSTTKEGTKIIPDGLLTPGSHVQYFFRRKDGFSPITTLAPDTNVVTPQNSEGSTDGHRWQEFSVLPDRWKSPAYTHPVLGTPGRNDACLLYVDQADRRNDERTWVGVADSIGATRAEKWGAHNGWHASGDGDVNDPASFVRRHIGSPGTTWDMLGVKASESGTARTSGIGSRGGASALSFNNPANSQINGKTSRQGPSFAYLTKFYKIVMLMSGDLNSSLLGPFNNLSTNDYKALQDFLISGDTGTPNRGYWQMGEGLVEDENNSAAGFSFMTNFLGVDLINPSYLVESGNTNFSADIVSTPIVEGDAQNDLYGVRNACTTTLDVLDDIAGGAGVDADPSTFYENIGANGPYISGVRKAHSVANPWIALTDGFDVSLLRATTEYSSRGRLTYFYNVFNNIFGAICDVQGATGITLDTPNNNDGHLFNAMSLRNSPLYTGSATVDLAIAKRERVKVQIFDVSGRVVRTLADHVFNAGSHKLTWDGVDNSNRQVARGVYFVRSQHADSKFTGKSKLIVLK